MYRETRCRIAFDLYKNIKKVPCAKKSSFLMQGFLFISFNL